MVHFYIVFSLNIFYQGLNLYKETMKVFLYFINNLRMIKLVLMNIVKVESGFEKERAE